MSPKLNNKGITFLEVLITLSFGFMLIYSIIVIPTFLIKDYKEFDRKMDYAISIVKISKSLYEDTSLEPGDIILNENQVTLGNSKYLFTNEGLYRENNARILLTNLKLTSFVENDLLILTIEDEKNEDIVLKYNLGFSSFSNGR